MNQIEGSAKAILSELVSGKRPKLTAAQQAAVASWIAMKTIVGDQDHPTTSAISASDCHAFYNDHRPPAGWKIWIGSYDGAEWQMGYTHFPFRATYGGAVPPHDRHYNIQATLFAAGSLFVLAYSSGIIPEFPVNGIESHLMPIWPFQSDPIDPESVAITTDADANRWYIAFENLVKLANG
ncbi:hypothetical protein JQ634_12725 [Bradyrhizobium sp. AUGA SZCCT0240]|uniref:hypothetical protein n=1 Tax=unclassified Bradyrhizobium TaxID=2631580 RepID=UPI001BA6EF9C|nr:MULTISPECIES: hypothetical protein [unclassified Bradyrhizobium]MBR1197574.1 hypothetical protein [Bradyrhizobium sp. AUGA SZCCT0158]MBR1241847.1 hypothetical protein [Bradyrhizobium sp. AUGA SZCCT0274]MBR1254566.1 hypothetical protein [Bradyrhizobium sp. AUGA SZCCT0240]